MKNNTEESYALTVIVFITIVFSVITLWLCPKAANAEERNQHSPDPINLGIYVREVPVVLHNDNDASIEGLNIKLDNAVWVWASEWTGAKYGVSENDDLSNVPTEIFLLQTDEETNSQTVISEFRLPVANKGKHRLFDFITQGGRGNISVAAVGPVPILSQFHNQPSGINKTLAEHYGLDVSFRLTPPNAVGERYYHLTSRNGQGATAVFSVFDNVVSKNETYLRSTHLSPNYDQWAPEYDNQGNVVNRHEADHSSNSFYRGRNWSDNLGTHNDNKSTLRVPGTIVAISQNIDLGLSTPGKYENLEPGSNVDVKAIVTNNSSIPVTTDLKYRINGSWQTVDDNISLEPQESKELYITLPVKMNPYSIIVKVNPAENNPPTETDWNNNTSVVKITPGVLTLPPDPVAGAPSRGDMSLNAVSQDGNITRPAGTAKWTDTVTANLTVTKPPIPFTVPQNGGDYIKYINVTGWQLEWAKLTHPRKNPEFTFGNPVSPRGVKTIDMVTNNNTATVSFRQDWSMAGAKVFNQVTRQLMADRPMSYPIKVDYRITYQYEWVEVKFTENGLVELGPFRGQDYIENSITKSLKVDGTGVNSRAQ